MKLNQLTHDEIKYLIQDYTSYAQELADHPFEVEINGMLLGMVYTLETLGLVIVKGEDGKYVMKGVEE